MIVFEADIEVHYGFVHLDSGVGGWDQDIEQCAGQRNGLLGAAQPGFLLVSTGMHTGLVPFRVEAHRSAPPLDGASGEIVEVSCDLRGPDVGLSTFDFETSFRLPEGGPHRVRLSARDFQAGREQERYEPQEPVRDSYLLQLWPAVMAPDEVVRVSSPDAAYWHAEALQQPVAPRSPQEQALAEQRDRDRVLERQGSDERAAFLRRWGGRDPSPRLLQVERAAAVLSRHRRGLVDAIAALPDDRQRGLALRLARRVCAADDGPLDWQPALDALAAGEPLPAPFDDQQAVFARLFSTSGTDTATATVTIESAGGEPAWQPLHTGVTADATVRAAAAADPFEAALRAVDAASWSMPDPDAYYVDVVDLVARS